LTRWLITSRRQTSTERECFSFLFFFFSSSSLLVDIVLAFSNPCCSKYREVCRIEEAVTISTAFIKGVLQKAKSTVGAGDKADKEKGKGRGSSETSTGSSASLLSTLSAEQEKDPLKYCLQQDDFLASFKEYLDLTYCTENLLFFLEASDFANAHATRSEGDTQALAAKIVSTFMKSGSPLEINIDDGTREAVLLNHDKGGLSAELFVVANQEVYTLMSSDSFPKWKKTKGFQVLWEKHGLPALLSPVDLDAMTERILPTGY